MKCFSNFQIFKDRKISFIVSVLIAGSTMSSAAPTGGSVTSGSATINQSGLVTTINQSTNKASINWQNFNIGASETVNFVQPSSSSVTLNRVVGATQSLIEGAMNANGHVLLLNPNGVLFANGSQINVGRLATSTLNITDANFQAGNYAFEGNFQNAVRNMGTVIATMEKVQLPTGEKISLNLNENSLIKFMIDPEALNTLIENKVVAQAVVGEVVHYGIPKAIDKIRAMNLIRSLVVNTQGQIITIHKYYRDPLVKEQNRNGSIPETRETVRSARQSLLESTLDEKRANLIQATENINPTDLKNTISDETLHTKSTKNFNINANQGSINVAKKPIQHEPLDLLNPNQYYEEQAEHLENKVESFRRPNY